MLGLTESCGLQARSWRAVWNSRAPDAALNIVCLCICAAVDCKNATKSSPVVIHTLTTWHWIPPNKRYSGFSTPSIQMATDLLWSVGLVANVVQAENSTWHWTLPFLAAPEILSLPYVPNLACWRMTGHVEKNPGQESANFCPTACQLPDACAVLNHPTTERAMSWPQMPKWVQAILTEPWQTSGSTQLTGDLWGIVTGCCFKSLNLGVFCYQAISVWYTCIFFWEEKSCLLKFLEGSDILQRDNIGQKKVAWERPAGGSQTVEKPIKAQSGRCGYILVNTRTKSRSRLRVMDNHWGLEKKYLIILRSLHSFRFILLF